jgi:hypothetical protein
VHLPRIAGHRDGDLTNCPGDAFYRRLPTIRPRVAQLAGAPARLTLSAASVVVAPATPVALAGSLTLLHGPPITGGPVEIQTVDAAGHELTVAIVTTGDDGAWSTSLIVTRGILVRALHRVAPASVSDLVEIGVAPVLTLTLGSASPLRVNGTIDPPKPSVTIVTYRLVNGHRQLVGSRHVAVRQGAFTGRPPLGRGRPGRYVVLAATTESDGTLAGASPPVEVTI